MTDAPERIMAYNEYRTGYTFTAAGRLPYFGPVEYIRADFARAEADRRVAKARAEEREACAQIAENCDCGISPGEIAAAIRARSEGGA